MNISWTVKNSRVVEIRDRWYSPQVINEYPLLLVSDDHGKTWTEKNIRGIWNLFPLLDVLQLDNPIVDIISSEGTIYIVSHSKYGTWDNSSGFYFSYKSDDDGQSWSSLPYNTIRIMRTKLQNQPNKYFFRINEKTHTIEHDYSVIINP